MKKILKTAIIGYGAAGKVFHAPFITSFDGFVLSKMSTSKKESAEDAKKSYPATEIVGTADEIINDPAIDLVVIATPNTSHASLAKASLEAGKHVIVDKPFTITSAEADEIISAARKANRVLSVHHNRRWDGHYKTIEKVIKSGVLGKLVDYQARYDRYRPALRENAWREKEIPGSGILYDLGSHLIDQSLDLFGLPKEIFADIQIQREGAQATDRFDLILHYPELNVHLSAGMLVREKGPSYTLHGDKGSFLKYGMDVQEDALKAGATPLNHPNWGVEPEFMWGSLETSISGLNIKAKVETEPGNYLDYFINVYDAITGRAPLRVMPEHARNTIRIVELATISNDQKKMVPYS